MNISHVLQVSETNQKCMQFEFHCPDEPTMYRRFLISIEKKHEKWLCEGLCVFNREKNRFEDVSPLFTESFLQALIQKIVNQSHLKPVLEKQQEAL
ncbi:hypothetical protein LCL95_01685 [Bacillus timonensis]|nr:hypothetical protein [Bacillus timonensis]